MLSHSLNVYVSISIIHPSNYHGDHPTGERDIGCWLLCMKAEPGFHKASIRMTTCQMRLGDIKAARAALEADPRLQAHADVVAKLADVKAHGSRISAVGLMALPGNAIIL